MRSGFIVLVSVFLGLAAIDAATSAIVAAHFAPAID